MNTRTLIPVDRVTPSVAQVLAAQGMSDRKAARRHVPLAEEAIALFVELAAPAGLWCPIDIEAFAAVYHGNGDNADSTPLAVVYPRSCAMALFAVTLGERITGEIDGRLKNGDFPLGAMLDAAASEGAELAAAELESAYADHLWYKGTPTLATCLMRFSPGYCGWHTSGQKRLFEHLKPGEIGIELSPSCLMKPLKSVSGVVVAGPREIFQFHPDFPFCNDCETYACEMRIDALREIPYHQAKGGAVS